MKDIRPYLDESDIKILKELYIIRKDFTSVDLVKIISPNYKNARELGDKIGNMIRKIMKLERYGLLICIKREDIRHYKINPDKVIFGDAIIDITGKRKKTFRFNDILMIKTNDRWSSYQLS